MFHLAFIGKLCSVLFFLGAWWFYIPPKNVDATTTTSKTEENKGNINEVISQQSQHNHQDKF